MTSISASLLARLQSHTPQQDAWTRLSELYAPVVYGRCRKAGIPAQDVADVGQNVFLDVMKCISEFRRDRPGDTFRGWMACITQRRIADYWRQRERVPGGGAVGGSVAQGQIDELPDQHPQPGNSGWTPAQTQSLSVNLAKEADTEEAETLRRRALQLIEKRFEPRTWRACCLVVLKGLPVKVVAEELGMSENAVRVAKSRVLDCLREEFGELLGDLLD